MSKYQALGRWLRACGEGPLPPVAFAEIERILSFTLPRSARQHRGWWANERKSHVQARAWMNAGWAVWEVDLGREQVQFVRTGFAATNSAEGSIGGVEDTGAPFVRDDVIVLQRSALRGGAIRLLEDFSEAHGGNLADAVAGILNGLVLERRRQLLERFPKTGAPSPVDSADLIREDRDAR